jgi:serine/threonine-protein kinase
MSTGGGDDATVTDPPGGDPTIQLPSLLAHAAKQAQLASQPSTSHSMHVRSSSLSLTNAVDALRDEEVARTRLFIRMGWAISAAAIAIVPLLGGPEAMRITFVAALVVGMIVSFVFHQRFADPTKFSDGALLTLAIMCVINGHLTILYYGAFTATPAIVVIGIHFVARTERVELARKIFAWATVCYVLTAAPIVIGLFPDPGVFTTDRPMSNLTLLVGGLFVLGVYWLAYLTARAFREASLRAIEQLQKQTRLASQRQALLDELRVDLERALRIGSPGRHTDQVVGELQLGVLLGRGAMGEVYEAVHRATGEPAAVKLLRRELLSDPTHVARFLREVRAVVNSPHVVKVLEASTAESAVPYLAMERLRGTTLAEILRKEPRLPVPQVVELVRQTAAGIDAAARAGIVHRDLKPQNLFRHTGDVWKILDFGVATLAEENTGTLTQGGIVGTPHYMAAEQAQSKRVDSRADLYAIAAIAYRCFTGRHPFTAPDTPALLYTVVHSMPPRPGELVELHEDVDLWFAIAMAKSPDDRFASGGMLTATLADAALGKLDAAIRRRADALLKIRGWDS